jgi:membrane protein DedA with SNARE-associated domain
MPEYLSFLAGSPAEVSAGALIVLLFVATFISEDAACVAAGTAAANGHISFAAGLFACMLGIFAGDLLLFGAGRVAGERIFTNRLVRRFVSPSAVSRAGGWLETNAGKAVFLSRFATGLRLPTYLAAGALGTDLKRFVFWFALAAAIWTPILVGSVAFAQTTVFAQNALLGVVALLVILRFALKLSTWKNRRLAIGRMKRIRHWEFWPLQVFYAPVVIYVFLLGLKYRNLSLFASANPAFPAGGFKGESKSDIYKALSRLESARPHILAHKLIPRAAPLAQRLDTARRFMDDNRLAFPLAVKPDAGERGKGVSIVRSFDELSAALSTAKADIVLQEFAAGEEFSIFYYRRPQERRGTIFSITEKRFPSVVGDGTSTLEELILADPRAVAMASSYFAQNEESLGRVPIQGEDVRLINIGTHSRGAIFLDGGWMKTELLESRIDEICRSLNGFFFGRFDVRSPTHADLENGERFKIIELNGVTSESTNIYDPRYSLFDAYRILSAQWRIAFEIGDENDRRGAPRTRLIDLLRLGLGIGGRPAVLLDRPHDSYR